MFNRRKYQIKLQKKFLNKKSIAIPAAIKVLKLLTKRRLICYLKNQARIIPWFQIWMKPQFIIKNFLMEVDNFQLDLMLRIFQSSYPRCMKLQFLQLHNQIMLISSLIQLINSKLCLQDYIENTHSQEIMFTLKIYQFQEETFKKLLQLIICQRIFNCNQKMVYISKVGQEIKRIEHQKIYNHYQNKLLQKSVRMQEKPLINSENK